MTFGLKEILIIVAVVNATGICILLLTGCTYIGTVQGNYESVTNYSGAQNIGTGSATGTQDPIVTIPVSPSGG